MPNLAHARAGTQRFIVRWRMQRRSSTAKHTGASCIARLVVEADLAIFCCAKLLFGNFHVPQLLQPSVRIQGVPGFHGHVFWFWQQPQVRGKVPVGARVRQGARDVAGPLELGRRESWVAVGQGANEPSRQHT